MTETEILTPEVCLHVCLSVYFVISLSACLLHQIALFLTATMFLHLLHVSVFFLLACYNIITLFFAIDC